MPFIRLSPRFEQMFAKLEVIYKNILHYIGQNDVAEDGRGKNSLEETLDAMAAEVRANVAPVMAAKPITSGTGVVDDIMDEIVEDTRVEGHDIQYFIQNYN